MNVPSVVAMAVFAAVVVGTPAQAQEHPLRDALVTAGPALLAVDALTLVPSAYFALNGFQAMETNSREVQRNGNLAKGFLLGNLLLAPPVVAFLVARAYGVPDVVAVLVGAATGLVVGSVAWGAAALGIIALIGSAPALPVMIAIVAATYTLRVAATLAGTTAVAARISERTHSRAVQPEVAAELTVLRF